MHNLLKRIADVIADAEALGITLTFTEAAVMAWTIEHPLDGRRAAAKGLGLPERACRMALDRAAGLPAAIGMRGGTFGTFGTNGTFGTFGTFGAGEKAKSLETNNITGEKVHRDKKEEHFRGRTEGATPEKSDQPPPLLPPLLPPPYTPSNNPPYNPPTNVGEGYKGNTIDDGNGLRPPLEGENSTLSTPDQDGLTDAGGENATEGAKTGETGAAPMSTPTTAPEAKKTGGKSLFGLCGRMQALHDGNDFAPMEAQFPDLAARKVDLAYYWHAVNDWSDMRNEMRTARGWLATIRTFVRRDEDSGRLRITSPPDAYARGGEVFERLFEAHQRQMAERSVFDQI